MKRFSRTLAAVSLLVLAALLALTSRAEGQPNAPPAQKVEIPGSGTELFRALLDREGIRPVTEGDLGRWAEDDLIVIVIGSPQLGGRGNVQPLWWARLAVLANGAALIASDDQFTVWEAGRNVFGDRPIAEYSGQNVQADMRDCYRNNTLCPYVVPVSPEELPDAPKKPGRVWEVFRGLTKIATNQPTSIRIQQFSGEYQYPLARLPKSSRTDQGFQFLEPPLFAVGGDGPGQPNGRPGYSFLAVADSSVYINQMIMEEPTQNYALAERTIRYLQGPDKHRKRCVFFENGRVVESFDGLKQSLGQQQEKVPPDSVPKLGPLFDKNQEKITDLGNRVADRFQEKDGLHNILIGKEGTPREQRTFAKALEYLLYALAAAVVLFLLGRTLTSRHSTDTPPPPNTGAGAATGPPGVFDRRQKELVRRNNLYEPVRDLLREFFDSAGAPPDAGPKPPRVSVTREIRKPESLRQAVRDMWRIAYGPPVPISARHWFELEPYFNRLRHAHADGKWQFATGEES